MRIIRWSIGDVARTSSSIAVLIALGVGTGLVTVAAYLSKGVVIRLLGSAVRDGHGHWLLVGLSIVLGIGFIFVFLLLLALVAQIGKLMARSAKTKKITEHNDKVDKYNS